MWQRRDEWVRPVLMATFALSLAGLLWFAAVAILGYAPVALEAGL